MPVNHVKYIALIFTLEKTKRLLTKCIIMHHLEGKLRSYSKYILYFTEYLCSKFSFGCYVPFITHDIF